jgi:hypothetical protein
MLYTSLSSLSVSRLCRAFAHDGDGDDHGGYQAGWTGHRVISTD